MARRKWRGNGFSKEAKKKGGLFFLWRSKGLEIVAKAEMPERIIIPLLLHSSVINVREREKVEVFKRCFDSVFQEPD